MHLTYRCVLWADSEELRERRKRKTLPCLPITTIGRRVTSVHHGEYPWGTMP